MPRNPYKYVGPLDPVKDKLVLVPRKNELKKVTDGIKAGEYWGIFGLRQIGKTTFLRQIRSKLKNNYHLYINFEISPGVEKNFYQWLTEVFKEQIPLSSEYNANEKWKDFDPEFRFMKFLEEFKPEDDKKKIILLFDEIERIPRVENFLHLWRNVYHQRDQAAQFKKYSVIITGSAHLIPLIDGKSSPYNVAKFLYMTDFSREEAEQLIVKPFAKLKLKISEDAKEKLLYQTSGHPQLLQHTCSKLVEIAWSTKTEISVKDVDRAIKDLFKNNTTLSTLKSDIDGSEKLRTLIENIFEGVRTNYLPYKEFSIQGAGSIIEKDSYCAIRNEIYKKHLKDILSIAPAKTRFENWEEVGQGGMGTVYRAEDPVLKRTVAIKKLNKELTQNEGNLKRFYEEARITASLNHKNIVRIYDVTQDNDDHVIIMEFIEGEDYEKIISKGKELPLLDIVRIAGSLFSALDYSHKKGIVHRDIKPSNIMKDQDNEIKVLDFGIASLGKRVAREEAVYIIGAPFYISPEQIRDDIVDHRADIYSAGATLFHLTTGQPPFKASTIPETLGKHLNKPIPSVKELRNDVPFELADLIERCMAKKKEDRFQCASEVLEKLKLVEEIIRNPDKEIGDRTERVNRKDIKINIPV